MTKHNARRTALTLMGAWALAGLLARPAGATDGHATPAHRAHAVPTSSGASLSTALSSGAQCPPQQSCGTGCTAELATGFCTVTFQWEGGISVGGVQLGPSVKVECHLCECWYIMPGPAGSMFLRKLDFGCGGSIEGLVLV